jgi:hypothetical protein
MSSEKSQFGPTADHGLYYIQSNQVCGALSHTEVGFLYTQCNSDNVCNPNTIVDETAMRAWRSETLVALHATAEYATARQELVNEVVSSLLGCLQVLLPEASKEQFEVLQKTLTEAIVLPAITLSERFHASSKLFGFSGRGNITKRTVKEDNEKHEFKNLHQTGKIVILQHGMDAQYITDICPGLFSRTIKGDEISTKKTLKRAQVLLAVQKPGVRMIAHADTALEHIYRCVEAQRKTEVKESAKAEAKSKKFLERLFG